MNAQIKKYYKWLLLLAPMLMLALGQAKAGSAPVKEHFVIAASSFSEEEETIDLPKGWTAALFHEAEPDAARDRLNTRLERKKKCRFIVRQNSTNQFLRKGPNKVYNFKYQLVADPDHAPAPDENWHTRPRYYVFLFRLCPF